MSDLTVYLAQINQFWEDKEKNLKHQESLISTCDFKKEGLLILPEMFNTSFTTRAEKFGEAWENSQSIAWLKGISKKHQIAISTSLIIEENANYYNRHVIVKGDTILAHYDKNQLFSLAGEHKSFTPGNKRVVLNYEGWNILPLVCYDLRFPELSRMELNEKGEAIYDLIIYVANWPQKRIHHWNKLLEARAIENLSYVIGLNRIGKDGNNLSYSGNSSVINPNGEKVLEFSENEEGIKTITLNKTALNYTRNLFGFLKDIR